MCGGDRGGGRGRRLGSLARAGFGAVGFGWRIGLCLVLALAFWLKMAMAAASLQLRTPKCAPLTRLAKPHFYHKNPAAYLLDYKTYLERFCQNS